MISETEFLALVSRRKPRHVIDTSAWLRARLCEPADDKLDVYSFEYEEFVVSVRAPYRAAVDAAVQAFRQECSSEVAVNYIRLLPSKFKHDDKSKVVRF